MKLLIAKIIFALALFAYGLWLPYHFVSAKIANDTAIAADTRRMADALEYMVKR